MDGYRVYIFRDNWRDPLSDNVRLMVTRRLGTDAVEYLSDDGTWGVVTEGTSPDDAGLSLPAALVEPLARAIEEFQGHASHADTEARVLREWLTVERERVDRSLALLSLVGVRAAAE